MNKELEALKIIDELLDNYIEDAQVVDCPMTKERLLFLKQALIQKPKVEVDYYTKVKIDRFFELWNKVDCDGDEILHDMKTPQEVEEMEQIRKDLNERGIEV